jgi:hypothetical protein
MKALSDECGKDRISTMLNDLMSINAGQMSALANAIEDALAPFGLRIYEAAPRPSISHWVATACQSNAVAPTGHRLALQCFAWLERCWCGFLSVVVAVSLAGRTA